MRVICDIETDGLNPTKVWIVVAKDIDTGEVYAFYPTRDGPEGQRRLLGFAEGVDQWIGHHFLSFDAPVLRRLCSLHIPVDAVLDTLVLSRLFDARRSGHSIEDWGVDLGYAKPHAAYDNWSTFTPEMEERCRGDVEVNYRLYKHFEKFITSPLWQESIRTEHFIQSLCLDLHENGFAFDYAGAQELKNKIDLELTGLEQELTAVFKPKVKCIKEITPRATKFGTLNRTDFRWLGSSPDLSCYSVGAVFSRIEYIPFNPRSHEQRIDVLWEAGWKPTEKSDTHKDTEKAVRDLKRSRQGRRRVDEITALEARLGEYGVSGLRRTGWKTTSEENLKTLPDTAPKEAQKLVRFVLLASRSSILQTWMNAYRADTGRIHGSFNSIGAWTHRMSHDKPNMGNIPKFDAKQPHKTPYSDAMRALWRSAADRYLVGVDADSIQLRILAHYIDDKEFTTSLISGDKLLGTDPHSVNQRALGAYCKSRDDAKTFIYAWLLGAGIDKVAEILGCTKAEGSEANDNFLDRYPGLRYIKDKVIPLDAERGYFKGLDGRFIRIWGSDVGSREHFALAGYLQGGEAIIMKRACQIWYPRLKKEGVPFWFVNFVHDEFQIETVRDFDTAKYVATVVADSIATVGADLNLRCPMLGSINNGHGKLAIGDNWMETH